MEPLRPRRSPRKSSLDLNGRGYLANLFGFPVSELEAWLQSEHVRPQLQEWYRLAVEDPDHYNYVLDLINQGVFEQTGNEFEEEILLTAFSEGDDITQCVTSGKIDISELSTIDLWTATVWGIASSSQDHIPTFHQLFNLQPLKGLSIVVDVLSIAFHSIAHRGNASCYHVLINGPRSGLEELEAWAEDDTSDIEEDDIMEDSEYASERFSSSEPSEQMSTSDSPLQASSGHEIDNTTATSSLPSIPTKRKFGMDNFEHDLIDDSLTEPMTSALWTRPAIVNFNDPSTVQPKRIKITQEPPTSILPSAPSANFFGNLTIRTRRHSSRRHSKPHK